MENMTLIENLKEFSKEIKISTIVKKFIILSNIKLISLGQVILAPSLTRSKTNATQTILPKIEIIIFKTLVKKMEIQLTKIAPI